MSSVRAKFTLHNLCCANCAAKMEEKISKLPGVEEASIVYVNKLLYLTAENPESYLPQIRKRGKGRAAIGQGECS